MIAVAEPPTEPAAEDSLANGVQPAANCLSPEARALVETIALSGDYAYAVAEAAHTERVAAGVQNDRELLQRSLAALVGRLRKDGGPFEQLAASRITSAEVGVAAGLLLSIRPAGHWLNNRGTALPREDVAAVLQL